jgi:hypothetical protein
MGMDLRQKHVRRDGLLPYWILILGLLVLMGLAWSFGLGGAGLAGVCPTVQNTQKFTFLYGEVTINATPAPPGSVVEARSPRGDTVGCRVVENAGEYPLMYVYGEETVAGTPIPGMREGEVIAFAVDGVPATPSPVPTWTNDKASHQVDLSATSAPCYDFDNSGQVDLNDIGEVASRWRTSCENPDPDNNGDTPNYEARYDINQDCIINVVDIMLVVKHWEETCP